MPAEHIQQPGAPRQGPSPKLKSWIKTRQISTTIFYGIISSVVAGLVVLVPDKAFDLAIDQGSSSTPPSANGPSDISLSEQDLVGLPPVADGWKCRASFALLKDQGLSMRPCFASVDGRIQYTVLLKASSTQRQRVNYWLAEYDSTQTIDRPFGETWTCELDLVPGVSNYCPIRLDDPPRGAYHVAATTNPNSRDGINSNAWNWSGDDWIGIVSGG